MKQSWQFPQITPFLYLVSIVGTCHYVKCKLLYKYIDFLLIIPAYAG